MVAIRRPAVLIAAMLWMLAALAADGESPLHQAVEKGDRKLVERLLAAGTDVNARTASGETPLHYARAANSASGHAALAKLAPRR